MNYQFAARKSEIAPGAMRSIEVSGHQILLANIGGTYHAVARKCSHFGADLCKGHLENGIVSCPKHGAKFDVRSGEAVGKASMLIFKMQPKNLRAYPVQLQGDDVLVGISG